MTAPHIPVGIANEFPGSEITGDLLEFVRAMHAFQQRYRRRYPSWSEVLYVLRTLGYAKRLPPAKWTEDSPPRAREGAERTEEISPPRAHEGT
jgi:hypothetical protein